MEKTPKSLRLHIAFFGKRNVGKSSLINCITNQDVSIVSERAGTTTDPVEKAMEILPIGPVVLIDTAGIDDTGKLGKLRIEKTMKIVERTDIAVIVCDYEGWNDYEINLFNLLQKQNITVVSVINKSDEKQISEEKLSEIENYVQKPLIISAKNDKSVTSKLKQLLIENLSDDFLATPTIIGDLLEEKDVAVLVIPIDKEAPKGRIILPQVQTLRDLLDSSCISIVTKESELQTALNLLTEKPKIVVTDSQAFKEVSKIVPDDVQLTSFSILFARLKGDLFAFADGVKQIDKLKDTDKILICESCTHHQIEDDIAKVKIPRLIKAKTAKNIEFEYYSSHDFPENIEQYSLIIHCGGCMTNRREILTRILKANARGVPITNYGITIAHCLGILDRAMSPFS